MEQSGNRKLREMSVGIARSKCKLSLRDDPHAQELKAKYDRWCADNEQVKQSMGASYRGVDKGGRMGRAE